MGADIFRRRGRNIRRIRTETKPARLRPKTCLHTKFHLDPLRGSRDLVATSVRTHTTNTIVSFACKAKLTNNTQGSLILSSYVDAINFLVYKGNTVMPQSRLN